MKIFILNLSVSSVIHLQQRRDTLTKLSQKIGVENFVGCKKVGLGINNNISEELRRLSIAANDEDSNEITHEELRLV